MGSLAFFSLLLPENFCCPTPLGLARSQRHIHTHILTHACRPLQTYIHTQPSATYKQHRPIWRCTLGRRRRLCLCGQKQGTTASITYSHIHPSSLSFMPSVSIHKEPFFLHTKTAALEEHIGQRRRPCLCGPRPRSRAPITDSHALTDTP